MSKEEAKKPEEIDRELYETELLRLQAGLIEMQGWVESTGARVIVIFEGRDAAGKGGVIKRVTEYLNPRIAQVVALPTPSKHEKSQWFFQCYIAHLPAADEIRPFDRFRYNWGGVGHVIGYCIANEHRHFLRQCLIFERILIKDGIILLEYWFSVSDKEQCKRLKSRMADPMRRWKLSPTDLESITRWGEYPRAKDEVSVHTDIDIAPRNVVESKDERKARINTIHHLLDSILYGHVERPVSEFPKRPSSNGYRHMDRALLRGVPDYASALKASSRQKKYVDLEDEEIL